MADVEKMELEKLREIALEAAKVAPGEWDSDGVESEDGRGKYTAFQVFYENPTAASRHYRYPSLVDTINSEVACIHEESDEDGVNRWDEPGRLLCQFIATFDPPTVLALIERVKVLEGEKARLIANWRSRAESARHFAREVADGGCDINEGKAIAYERCADDLSALSNATGGEGYDLPSQPCGEEGPTASLPHTAEPSASEVPLAADGLPKPRLDMGRRRFTRCQADDDGYCEWGNCPQLRDDEPARTGRHCPLDCDEGDE